MGTYSYSKDQLDAANGKPELSNFKKIVADRRFMIAAGVLLVGASSALSFIGGMNQAQPPAPAPVAVVAPAPVVEPAPEPAPVAEVVRQSPRDKYLAMRNEGYAQPDWMGESIEDEWLANHLLKSCRFDGWAFDGQCNQLRWEMEYRGYQVNY
jgi:hypothetical protein